MCPKALSPAVGKFSGTWGPSGPWAATEKEAEGPTGRRVCKRTLLSPNPIFRVPVVAVGKEM